MRNNGNVLVGILIFLIIVALLLILMRGCGVFGSLGPAVPNGLTVAGPATIPAGGGATFTVTLTTNTAPVTAQTFTVILEEDDYWDDALGTVQVTVPTGATTGTASFTLSCDNGKLVGPGGSSDPESEFDVHAEYDRFGPNLKSANAKTKCVAD